MQTNLFSNRPATTSTSSSQLATTEPGFPTTNSAQNSSAADPAIMDDRGRHHQRNISDPSSLPDRDLYRLCQEYGANARLWSRKFASLLPEVARRQLYRKRGFYSIYEFAGKLAGMSHKTVDEVLRVYRRVEGKPLLAKQIEKFGWAKVRAVASLAGEIEEENLVEMIKTLPRGALEECVRELKRQNVPTADVMPTTDVIPAFNVIPACLTGRQAKACPRLRSGAGIQQHNPLTPTCWGRIASQTGMLCEIDVQKNSESYVSGYCGNGEVGSAEESARIGDVAGKRESGAAEAVAMDGNPENETSAWALLSFRVSPETEFRFRKLQQKLEKERKQKVGFNDVLSAVMDMAEELTSLKNAGRRQKGASEIVGKAEELEEKLQERASHGQNQETTGKSESDRKIFKEFEGIQNSEKQAQQAKDPKGHPPRRTKPLSGSTQQVYLLSPIPATKSSGSSARKTPKPSAKPASRTTKHSSKKGSAKISTASRHIPAATKQVTQSSRRAQGTSRAVPASPSRYIPAATRQSAIQKHNSHCAFPGCNKHYEVLHHPERFALKKSHENLTPLCKIHHFLAHAGLVAHENSSPENWQIRPKRDKIDIKYLVDGDFLKKALIWQ